MPAAPRSISQRCSAYIAAARFSCQPLQRSAAWSPTHSGRPPAKQTANSQNSLSNQSAIALPTASHVHLAMHAWPRVQEPRSRQDDRLGVHGLRHFWGCVFDFCVAALCAVLLQSLLLFHVAFASACLDHRFRFTSAAASPLSEELGAEAAFRLQAIGLASPQQRLHRLRRARHKSGIPLTHTFFFTCCPP